MTNVQRLRDIFYGIVMIVCAVLIMCYPDVGYVVVTFILSATLLLRGCRWLVYYFTMARHMVNGRWSLYTGAFLLDLGIFTASITNVPRGYVIAYLIAANGFSALVSLVRARDSRGTGSPHWKFDLVQGVVELVMVLACIVFCRSLDTVTIVFGIGLINSGLFRIARAFQRTALVYIEG